MATRKTWKRGMIFGGDNLSMGDLLHFAEMADAAGADSLWTAEIWRDAFVPLTAMASMARRVRLGTAIAQLARPPWHTEMSAMTRPGFDRPGCSVLEPPEPAIVARSLR